MQLAYFFYQETLYELQDRNMPGTGAANLDPNGEGVRDQRDVKEKLNLSDVRILLSGL